MPLNVPLLRGVFAAVSVLMAAAPVVLAQVVPTPGTVREPLKKPALEAPSTAPQVTEPVPAQQPRVPAGGPKIQVQRFVIDGNQVFSDEELHGVIADLQAKPLTLLEIYDAADRLTEFYRSHGFSLTTVTVPAQKLNQGTVRLAVVEGTLGRLSFDGNQNYSQAYLGAQMDELQAGEIIRREVLERELLLLNDLPGLKARAVVKPGGKFGTADVVIRTNERLREGSIEFNNYGRESIGRVRGVGNLVFNNPFHHGDRLALTAVHAQGGLMDYGRVDYSLALNPRGTRARVLLSRFSYKVDTKVIGLSGTQLRGTGNDVRIQLTHPLIRSRQSNLALGVGFTHNVSAQGGVPLPPAANDTYINLFDLSALYSHQHTDNSFSSIGLTASSNFRYNNTGTRNNAQKGKFEFTASHTRPMPAGWTLHARANAVVSLDPLMSTQRFRIGGQGSVRAFPSSELAGDQGFMMSLEGSHSLKLIDGVKARGRVFWDAGIVHRKSHSRQLTGEEQHASLTGLGAGLTLNWSRYKLDLEGVVPTNSHSVSDGQSDARLWVQLGAGF